MTKFLKSEDGDLMILNKNEDGEYTGLTVSIPNNLVIDITAKKKISLHRDQAIELAAVLLNWATGRE